MNRDDEKSSGFPENVSDSFSLSFRDRIQRERIKEVGANVLETEIFPKHETSSQV